MRIRMTAVLICAALVPASASAEETVISCDVRGHGLKNYDYKTVVSGELKLNLADIVIKPKLSGGGCYTVGRRSRTFGAKGGTRLEIGAFKCSTDDAYFTVKVRVAGRTVSSHIDGLLSRFTFNTDASGSNNPGIVKDAGDAYPPDSPIVIPEGTFPFLYVDCAIKKIP